MKIIYSSKFEREYKNLPLEIKKKAEKRVKIFRKKPFSTRLDTHKLKGDLKGFWSFSIDDKYRIIFQISKDKKTAYFHSAGDHSIYK